MKKNLSFLLHSIALTALSNIQQEATANTTISVLDVTEASESESFTIRDMKEIKASLKKPSFILRSIDASSGMYEGNFHRSHRSHSSHRSHYSSYSGSSGSSSSGGSRSYSSGSSSGTSSSSSSSGSSTSSSSYSTTKTYKLGDRTLRQSLIGSDVIELKKKLREKGYLDSDESPALNDYFSSDTESAVRRLQQSYGLSADGVVTPEVLVYLNSNIAPKNPVPQANSSLGYRKLQWGLTGPDVIELKKKLHSKGLLKKESGQSFNDRFDDATEQAVKAFQQTKGIVVNGVVDQSLANMLLQ